MNRLHYIYEKILVYFLFMDTLMDNIVDAQTPVR
jgi:hypothetical protein